MQASSTKSVKSYGLADAVTATALILQLQTGASAEIFSGGGASDVSTVYYLLDRIKLYSCNQDFAKRLEPTVK